jgi:arylsulfatase
MKGGKLKYCYNWLDKERYTIESKDALAPGKQVVKFDFKYDGGGLGKGGTGILYVNDQKVGEGRIERTEPFIFSADETEDVGEDLATPVTEDYKESDNKFNGTIDKITLAIIPPPVDVEKAEETEDSVIDEEMN